MRYVVDQALRPILRTVALLSKGHHFRKLADNCSRPWICIPQKINLRLSLTLQTVRIEKILALLMTFHPTLCATYALPGETPQQALTLEAIGWWGGWPHNEVMRRRGRYRVDERLQRLLVHVHFLWERNKSCLEQQIMAQFIQEFDFNKT